MYVVAPRCDTLRLLAELPLDKCQEGTVLERESKLERLS